jgi:hypothetical protein
VIFAAAQFHGISSSKGKRAIHLKKTGWREISKWKYSHHANKSGAWPAAFTPFFFLAFFLSSSFFLLTLFLYLVHEWILPAAPESVEPILKKDFFCD